MTLTNADLDAWERLAEAATPGPWRMQTAACDHPDADEHVAIKGGGRLVVPCVEEPADAALIAAARLAIPALVAEVRRLRAEVERPWIGCPGCAGALAGLVDRLCGSCRAQTVAAFGCGAPDCRSRCGGCEAPTPSRPPIGSRWGDLTPEQRAALPAGTRIEWCGTKTRIGTDGWQTGGGMIWATDELSDNNTIVSYPEAPK